MKEPLCVAYPEPISIDPASAFRSEGCQQVVSHIGRQGQSDEEKASGRQLLQQLLQHHVLGPICKPEPGYKEVPAALSAVAMLADPIADLMGPEVRRIGSATTAAIVLHAVPDCGTLHHLCDTLEVWHRACSRFWLLFSH